MEARRLFDEDSLITYRYNNVLGGGRWKHFMDQTHIGYTYWQQPDYNSMPAVRTIEIPESARMGVAVEGSEEWWPARRGEAVLPELNLYGAHSRSVEVFNQGKKSFEFRAKAGKEWIRVNPDRGNIDDEQHLSVTIDWRRTPFGMHRVPIAITGAGGQEVVVTAIVNKPAVPVADEIHGFVESDGVVSMEAEHYTRAVAAPPITWLRIPQLGRTLSGMTPVPVTSDAREPGKGSPRLEYRMHIAEAGEVTVRAFLSPTLNFHKTQGLRFGLSFDDEPPQIVNMHAQESLQLWERWVSANINEQITRHRLEESGWHVLKFWMVDPGVVLQKLVVETGERKASYLGPPESYRKLR
jgi:hypothetical protein